MSNFMHIKLWDVIIIPWPYFTGGFNQPRLWKSDTAGHILPRLMWVYLADHVLNSRLIFAHLIQEAGHKRLLFYKPMNLLPQDLVKSRSGDIRI